MSEAAKIIRDTRADIIDINLGCPVKKIVKACAGVKLLDNEKHIFEILESVVKSVEIPVTIKIRTGLLPGQNLAPEIINITQNCILIIFIMMDIIMARLIKIADFTL
jgi:tRNA-dihydrouridine synthase B